LKNENSSLSFEKIPETIKSASDLFCLVQINAHDRRRSLPSVHKWLTIEAVKNTTLIAMLALGRPVLSEATVLDLDTKKILKKPKII
jgi:hypothetical protein